MGLSRTCIMGIAGYNNNNKTFQRTIVNKRGKGRCNDTIVFVH